MRSEISTPQKSADSSTPAVVIGLIALTLLAYFPAFHAGWVWDDPQYVLNNITLRDLNGLRTMWTDFGSLPQWYPLVHTTFWIEYQLWGTQSAAGYHATNICLHLISALLLWRLLLTLEVPGALLAAALFAVHPVHVESVAWVTERKNVLSLLFYLLALRAYLSWENFSKPDPLGRGSARAYAIALLLFICALLSKSVTASFPAAVLVIIWWKRGRIARRDILPLLPFFALGLTMASITSWLEHVHVGADASRIVEFNLSPVQRALIASRAVWFYAGKLIAPLDLTFIYPRWDSIDRAAAWLWIFPIASGAVITSLWALRKKIGRGPLATALLFIGTLVPALGFVNVYPMRFSFVADHFQYHASIALIVLFAALLTRKKWERIGIVLVVVLAVLTYRRANDYENAVMLWSDTWQKNPQSWMVNTNLGKALIEENQIDAAEPYFLNAVKLAPKIFDTHVTAGNVYGRRGDYGRAIEAFQESIRLNLDFAPAYFGWGQVLERQNQPEAAMEKYQEALRRTPRYPLASLRLGQMLEQRGQRLDALKHYRDAVTYDPDLVEARIRLASLTLALGEFEESLAHSFAATRLSPQSADAWYLLGRGQLATGHTNDARISFQNALTLRPNFIQAAEGLREAHAR